MHNKNFKLFMLLLGCKPEGRHTEQHDTFFTIAENIKDTEEDVKKFWPEAGNIHVDAWREVTDVAPYYKVRVVPKRNHKPGAYRLFFLNLGGYKPGEFDEFHYKFLVAAPDESQAIRLAKETAFFRHTGFPGAPAHIDDKYGVDVDDIFDIEDILPEAIKKKFSIAIELETLPEDNEDQIHLGYQLYSKM